MMMIKKFRKKPVIIEAMLWEGPQSLNFDTAGFLAHTTCYLSVVVKDGLDISTLEGVMTASPGDYIIKGIKGEIYPCKPDIFEATYEEVEVVGRYDNRDE